MTTPPLPLPLHAFGAGWLVVEKPCGMSVHNDPGRDLTAAAGRLLNRLSDPAERITPEPDFGIRPVHRLDRETSGLVLLSCRASAHRHLSRQFQDREVEKHYRAILHGHLDSAEPWRHPLSRAAAGRRHPAGSAPRIACETRIRIETHTPHYTLVTCQPVTGRKHQIRRHAALAGHPVAGDTRYAGTRAIRFLAERCSFRRLALHAHTLAFTAPEDGRRVSVTLSPLPPEMERLLEMDARA